MTHRVHRHRAPPPHDAPHDDPARPAYSLAGCAARCGVSPERLRKAWRTWVANWAFPAPFRRPPAANFAWDADGVDAWVAGRSRALGEAAQAPISAANDGAQPAAGAGSPRAAQLARQRAELKRLMENA